MTATKQKEPAFAPGANTYYRDDVLLVEVKPNIFVTEEVALTKYGVKPKRRKV